MLRRLPEAAATAGVAAVVVRVEYLRCRRVATVVAGEEVVRRAAAAAAAAVTQGLIAAGVVVVDPERGLDPERDPDPERDLRMPSTTTTEGEEW